MKSRDDFPFTLFATNSAVPSHTVSTLLDWDMTDEEVRDRLAQMITAVDEVEAEYVRRMETVSRFQSIVGELGTPRENTSA